MIDSLKLFESLKSADLPESQARAITQAIGVAFTDDEARQTKALATKVDTDKLDSEVNRVETSLKEDIRGLGFEIRAEMVALRAEFKGDMGALRTELKGDIGQLETKIAESKSAMIAWMFVFWVGQVAAMKFLK